MELCCWRSPSEKPEHTPQGKVWQICQAKLQSANLFQNWTTRDNVVKQLVGGSGRRLQQGKSILSRTHSHRLGLSSHINSFLIGSFNSNLRRTPLDHQRHKASFTRVTVHLSVSPPYRHHPPDRVSPHIMAPIALYPTPQGSPGPVDLKEHLQPSVDQPQSSLFHHATPRPVAISAQGLYFTLDDGRTVLDGMSGGAAVACLGQGNTEVLGAMMEQASKMAYSYHLSVGCEAGEKLAAMICAKGDFEAAAFLNSGK